MGKIQVRMVEGYHSEIEVTSFASDGGPNLYDTYYTAVIHLWPILTQQGTFAWQSDRPLEEWKESWT